MIESNGNAWGGQLDAQEGMPGAPGGVIDTRAELISIADVAAMLSVSKATVERMHAAGELPEPIRLRGKTVRWDRTELRDWWRSTKKGGQPPSRAEWTARRKAGRP